MRHHPCNLIDANFRDTDLRNVEFYRSKLTNVDFRGADLTNCKFHESYQNGVNPQKPESVGLQGLKFSTTQKMEGHLFWNKLMDDGFKIDNEAFNKKKNDDIRLKEAKINSVYSWTGINMDKEKYDSVNKEPNDIRNRKFDKKLDSWLA